MPTSDDEKVFETFPPETGTPQPFVPKALPPGREPQPWDQLDRETNKAYNAFLTYLNLGPLRTYVKAFQISRNKPDSKVPDGSFAQWKVRFFWARRAKAYDDWTRQKNVIEQEAVLLKSLTQRTEKSAQFRDRMFDMAESLIDKAERMLAFPLEEVSRSTVQDGKTVIVTVKPTRWTFSDIGGLLTQAQKMRVLGMGIEEAPNLLRAEQIIEQLAEQEGLNDQQKAEALANLQALAREPKTGRSGGN